VTFISIALVAVFTRGMTRRLLVLVGLVVATLVYALLANGLGWGKPVSGALLEQAAWFGMPAFTAPVFDTRAIVLIAPVALILVAENLGHLRAVSAMTGRTMDPYVGRAFLGDGVATMVAGGVGGTGVTTYAENIGVMAATRVYSTAAYWVAGIAAIVLALCPKVGATISAIPPGVLGGATIVLYGLVGVLGIRIWLTNQVDFSLPINQMTAAIALIIGIADFTWQIGDLIFTGIALGSIAALVVYHGMRGLSALRGNPASD